MDMGRLCQLVREELATRNIKLTPKSVNALVAEAMNSDDSASERIREIKQIMLPV